MYLVCQETVYDIIERYFVYIQDMGNELVATTSDGHVYASTSRWASTGLSAGSTKCVIRLHGYSCNRNRFQDKA